jgi:fructose-bisphosphate aldolase / 2-amino-3,7-dideoxy-D-threo-hept-6-ulosonate synthase
VSQHGKHIRLRRILYPGRGTLIVAFDHGLVLGPIAGIENPRRQIGLFIEGRADALLLNLGLFGQLAHTDAGEYFPALIARLDWTTAMGTANQLPPTPFRSCLVGQPEDALQAGADAVIAFLVIGSGDAEFEKGEIRRVARVSRECEHLGLPLIVESVARGPGIQNPRDPQCLMLHTRIAAELGADAIKTEYSGDPETMRAVVEACPIPILVLGGTRTTSDAGILDLVRNIMQSGAAGVFFGRNVFQAENIPELLRRIHIELRTSMPVARK